MLYLWNLLKNRQELVITMDDKRKHDQIWLYEIVQFESKCYCTRFFFFVNVAHSESCHKNYVLTAPLKLPSKNCELHISVFLSVFCKGQRNLDENPFQSHSVSQISLISQDLLAASENL